MRKMWNCPKKRCDIAIAYVGVKVKGAYICIYMMSMNGIMVREHGSNVCLLREGYDVSSADVGREM